MSVFKKYISNNEEEAANQASPKASANNNNSTKQEPKKESRPAVKNTSNNSANKPAPSKQTPSKQAAAPSSKVAATHGRNVLSSDVEIKGRVKFANDLVVDGLIEGEIVSDGSLTVGENARIKAEINTRSVVIYGKVHGNINVKDRVDIRANAELVGDIKAGTLSIEAGAIFVGKSTVGAPSSVPASKSAEKKQTAKA